TPEKPGYPARKQLPRLRRIAKHDRGVEFRQPLDLHRQRRSGNLAKSKDEISLKPDSDVSRDVGCLAARPQRAADGGDARREQRGPRKACERARNRCVLHRAGGSHQPGKGVDPARQRCTRRETRTDECLSPARWIDATPREDSAKGFIVSLRDQLPPARE